jgi:hypothetical protein
MAAGFVHNERPQAVQRKLIKQRADVRGKILAHSSQIIEDKDRKQETGDRGKRRLEAEGGMLKQRAEVFECGMGNAEGGMKKNGQRV